MSREGTRCSKLFDGRYFLLGERTDKEEAVHAGSRVISNYASRVIRGADYSDRSHPRIKGKLPGMGGRVTRRIGHFNYTREPRLRRIENDRNIFGARRDSAFLSCWSNYAPFPRFFLEADPAWSPIRKTGRGAFRET